MSEVAEKLGFIACFYSIIPFIPQIIKIYKSGTAQGVSLTTYIFFCIGAVLWGTYGILTHSIPIILSNLMSLALEVTIIVLKLKKSDFKKEAKL